MYVKCIFGVIVLQDHDMSMQAVSFRGKSPSEDLEMSSVLIKHMLADVLFPENLGDLNVNMDSGLAGCCGLICADIGYLND